MKERRILVVGASSVLGGAAARQLEIEGARVVGTYHRPERAHLAREAAPQAELVAMDVRDTSSVSRVVAEVAAKGAIDGLVYSAGVGLLCPASHTTDARMEDVMEVNVQGALRLARACLPYLQQGTDPSVIFISSIMGLTGAAGMSAYGASKAAIVGLTQTLAIEWATRGIRVNAVAPGIVPSPLVDKMFKALGAEDIELIRRRHPLGFGQPEDVGHAISFLVSRRARWITGVILPVDGGYTAQ